MKEDKLIEEMFYAARNETPRLQVEQISESIIHRLGNSGLSAKWWYRYSLNGLIAALLVTAGIAYFMTLDTEPNDSNSSNVESVQVPQAEQHNSTLPDTKVPPIQSSTDTDGVLTIGSSALEPSDPASSVTNDSPQPASTELSSSINAASEVEQSPALTPNFNSPVEESEIQHPQTDEESIPVPMREHHCILVRVEGAPSADRFEQYLQTNTPSGFEFNFNARANTKTVQTFTLKINNSNGVDVRIQSTGFNKFEFFWKVDQNNKPYGIWYRFDDREKKPLNLNEHQGSSIIKVKYRSV